MKVESYDGTRENLFVTGMIADPVVLAGIAPRWEKDAFQSKPANLIASWCVRHWEKYGKPPGKGIESYFKSFSERTRDESTKDLISLYLSSLSDNYTSIGEDIDSAHLLDEAAEHLNKVKITRLADSLKADAEAGRISEAEERLSKHSRIEIGTGCGEDLFTDKAAFVSAFQGQVKDIVEYPGAAGRFFRGCLEREGFVVFTSPPKVGKTWWLIDIAWRAMMQRKRVGFIEIGDLSGPQIKMRLASRCIKRPYKSKEWPAIVKWPTAISPPAERSKDGEMEFAGVESSEKKFNRPFTAEEGWDACVKMMKDEIRSDKSYFKLSVHPNFSISMSGIKAIVDGWRRQGFFLDILCLDYMDLLASPHGSGRMDARDQINTSWKQARALCQEGHFLLATATQANRGSFNKWVIDRSDIGEDIRKLAHATAIFGINQKAPEKERHVQRINCIAAREMEFSPSQCLHVATCLPLANPCVKSCL